MSNYVRAASKVTQQENGMYTDSRERNFFCGIDKTKIKLLYPVPKMALRHLQRKHKRRKIT